MSNVLLGVLLAVVDPTTLIAAVTGAFAGTAFPAAVAWRFIGILTQDIRSLRDELRDLRLALGNGSVRLVPGLAKDETKVVPAVPGDNGGK